LNSSAAPGHRILERYGMTETGMLTSNPLEGDGARAPWARRWPEWKSAWWTTTTSRAPRARSGNVQVKGRTCFPATGACPSATRRVHRRRLLPHRRPGQPFGGRVPQYRGRSKDLIITGGYNVYPKEIELAIDELPGVEESAVIGVPHADFGEAVTAWSFRTASTCRRPRGEIIAALKRKLANFKVPKRVHFVDDLPRNAMGKVQKNVLRERFGKD
jgi:malonyl-CoA/methylmalonyl-CoA synthetase